MAGADAVESAGDADLPVLVKAYTDGLLLGAKGNCGVIMSQLVRACFGSLDVGGELTAADVAAVVPGRVRRRVCRGGAPGRGHDPVGGRPPQPAAPRPPPPARDGRAAFARAGRAAREALARTPMQMERLAKAGVVDAGGRALVVVLDATEQAFTGRVPRPRSSTRCRCRPPPATTWSRAARRTR